MFGGCPSRMYLEDRQFTELLTTELLGPKGAMEAGHGSTHRDAGNHSKIGAAVFVQHMHYNNRPTCRRRHSERSHDTH